MNNNNNNNNKNNNNNIVNDKNNNDNNNNSNNNNSNATATTTASSDHHTSGPPPQQQHLNVMAVAFSYLPLLLLLMVLIGSAERMCDNVNIPSTRTALSAALAVPSLCDWIHHNTKVSIRMRASSCTQCRPGYFFGPGSANVAMGIRGSLRQQEQRPLYACRPLLNCGDMLTQISGLDSKPFARGGVKEIIKARWNGWDVAVSRSLQDEDFTSGVNMLKILHNTSRVIQLLGACIDGTTKMMVTPYYPVGSAHNWEAIVKSRRLSPAQEFSIRSRAGLDFLSTLLSLHGDGDGDGDGDGAVHDASYVICDAREGPIKLLSQFVVTNDLRLVLADVDATPNARAQCEGQPQGVIGVKCGHRQFYKSDFVAPEQLWPEALGPFNDLHLACYNEKVDVWRIPETLAMLLGTGLLNLPTPHNVIYHLRMQRIVAMCKQPTPSARANAGQVYDAFVMMMSGLETSVFHHDRLN